MKETRRYDISNRVFTKPVLYSVANALWQEYAQSLEAKSHSSFAFKISCADDTSYESQSLELLADASMVDIKKVDTVDIDYYDYKADRYANFTIAHGNTYHNVLLVRGNDSNWVNGAFNRLKETVDSAQPQQSFYLKHKGLFFNLISLGTGTVLEALLTVVVQALVKPIDHPGNWVLDARSFFVQYPFVLHLMRWASRWGMGMAPANGIHSYLKKLWPRIEFDFGPEHQRYERQRRARVQFALVTVALPTIVAIVYDLIKAILHV